MGRALYLLKNSHLRDPKQLPRPLCEYRMAVAVPNLNLDAAKNTAPDTTFCAYFDTKTVPHYGADHGIYGRERVVMAEHMRTDPATGSARTNRYGNYELELTFDAMNARAWFIAENYPQWAVLYLDNAWGIPPLYWLNSTDRDCMETLTRWPLVLEYFIRRLRAMLTGVTIAGNIGSGQVPDSLDAFTLESGHVDQSQRAMHLARFAGRRHDLNVLWRGVGEGPIMRLDDFDGIVLDGDRTL